MCQLNFPVLSVGEAGSRLSLHQWRAIISNVTDHAGRVVYEDNRLAGIVEGLEQIDGITALREVPYSPVTAT